MVGNLFTEAVRDGGDAVASELLHEENQQLTAAGIEGSNRGEVQCGPLREGDSADQLRQPAGQETVQLTGLFPGARFG